MKLCNVIVRITVALDTYNETVIARKIREGDWVDYEILKYECLG